MNERLEMRGVGDGSRGVVHAVRSRRAAAHSAPSPIVRVVVAEGQGLVRAGLRLLLEATERISVIGEAASGEEAVALANRFSPDVAVIDGAVPGLGSVEATRQDIASIGRRGNAAGRLPR